MWSMPMPIRPAFGNRGICDMLEWRICPRVRNTNRTWILSIVESNASQYNDAVNLLISTQTKTEISGDELISYTFLVWRQCVQFGLRARLRQRTRDKWANFAYASSSTGFWTFSTRTSFASFSCLLFFWEIFLCFDATCTMRWAHSVCQCRDSFSLIMLLFCSSSRWTCFFDGSGLPPFVDVVADVVDGCRHVVILSTFRRRQQKYYCDDSLVLSDDCRTAFCIAESLKFI